MLPDPFGGPEPHGVPAVGRLLSPWRESACRAVVVAGGRRGVGTSTVAGLLGLLAAEAGYRVLLVDGDPTETLLRRLRGRSHPLPVPDGEPRMVRLGECLSVLAGGGEGDAGARLFRRVAALGDRHELIVIDGGSRLEGVAGACAVGVERLLAVTTADRVGVTALYALIKAVDGAFPGTPVEVVVNGQEEDAARRVFEQVQAGIARFRGRGARFAGALPEDACLRAGVGGGMTLYDAAVGSAIARTIEEIAARILFELHTHLPAVAEPRHLQWRV